MSQPAKSTSQVTPATDHTGADSRGVFPLSASGFTLREFQSLIELMYSAKDRERGVEGTFMWLMEEVGELASSLRAGSKDRENLALEFADVLAWLVTIANIVDIDLQTAILQKYGTGCPGCGQLVCTCAMTEKP